VLQQQIFSMKKQQIKICFMAASLTVVNWLIINFLIIEINFFKYLLIEGIWAISHFIYERERTRIRA
jgi:hypothetical protein